MIERADGRTAAVLLAEDNEDEVTLLREGFRSARLPVRLHHVWNGQECLDYLQRGSRGEVPSPDLVLLDLNMPVLDGRQALARIVEDPRLRHLPVLVLTTSRAAADIDLLYALRCSSYIVKPIDFDSLVGVVKRIHEYWFTTVALPARSGPA